jgi:hypothetical protein
MIIYFIIKTAVLGILGRVFWWILTEVSGDLIIQDNTRMSEAVGFSVTLFFTDHTNETQNPIKQPSSYW